MSKAGRVIGTVIVFVTFIIVWNFVAAPIINAPIHKSMDCHEARIKLLDQEKLALDQRNQVKADNLQLQVDAIKC